MVPVSNPHRIDKCKKCEFLVFLNGLYGQAPHKFFRGLLTMKDI
jgi:hypothetical protein